MKEIILTQGKVALVDDADFEWLNQWKWHYINAGPTGYAVRTAGGRKNKQYIYMHRLINNTPVDMQTDHVDGDGLNNQRGNLRTCTRTQNNGNRPIQPNNTSGFRGVVYDKFNDKWVAQINVRGKHINLGRFVDKIDAAIKYNEAADHFFGQFAKLNEV